MPAATGTRLTIVSRCGGPSQPLAARQSASARAARFGPVTPAQTTSSAASAQASPARPGSGPASDSAPGRGSSVSSSASDSGSISETSS